MHHEPLYWIVFLNAFGSFYCLGLMIAMQVLIYPKLGANSRGQLLNFPMILTLFCSLLLIFFHGPLMPLWFLSMGLAVQAAILIFTGYIWMPILSKLQVKDKRVNWHWIRVGLVSFYTLLAISEMSLFVVGRTMMVK